MRNYDLFTPKWVDGLKKVPESGMDGEILIYTTEVGYDGFKPTEVRTVLYEGKARVQPLRTPRQAEVPGDDVKVQQVQFQIPVANIGIQLVPSVHKVQVTECELNPTLLAFRYVLREVVDSSNPIEKTFVCEVITDGR